MDILAMRKSIGNLTGVLMVNGARATKRFIKKTAYVPQVGGPLWLTALALAAGLVPGARFSAVRERSAFTRSSKPTDHPPPRTTTSSQP
jgi:hypothetical protein